MVDLPTNNHPKLNNQLKHVSLPTEVSENSEIANLSFSHTLLIVLLDWVNQTLKELRFVFQKVITLSYTIKDGNLGKTYQERERMRPQEVAFAQDQHG